MIMTVTLFENVSLGEIKVHFDIVRRHLEHRLKTDFDNRVERINTEADFNVAINILQRSLEQAQTLFALMEQKHIDITSIAAIQRSLYESFLTFVYLFATNIFQDGSSGDSKEQVLAKLFLHEYLAFKCYQNVQGKFDIDLKLLIHEEEIEKLEKAFISRFSNKVSQELIEEHLKISKLPRMQKKKLKSIFKSKYIYSESFLLKDIFQIGEARGLNDAFFAAYNYLSDYAHCGKLSLAEYAPREYENDESKTILSMAKLCLVIISQFFLEYSWYCKTIWNDPIEIDDHIKHPKRDSQYDSVEILEYWINYFREEEFQRPHFKAKNEKR